MVSPRSQSRSSERSLVLSGSVCANALPRARTSRTRWPGIEMSSESATMSRLGDVTWARDFPHAKARSSSRLKTRRSIVSLLRSMSSLMAFASPFASTRSSCRWREKRSITPPRSVNGFAPFPVIDGLRPAHRRSRRQRGDHVALRDQALVVAKVRHAPRVNFRAGLGVVHVADEVQHGLRLVVLGAVRTQADVLTRADAHEALAHEDLTLAVR